MPLTHVVVAAASSYSPYSPTREHPSIDVHYSPPVTKAKIDASHFEFDSVQDALDAFRRGEFVVVMDDDNRENEGDLICAASAITTEKMAWLIKHSSGYVCISLPGDRLDELQLPPMVPNNEEKHKTAYTITVDYKYGTTTGISAHDRALTARKLADPSSLPTDFNRPGHLCPLRAREGGVLTRRGHTEAGTDLCQLARLPRAAILCEIVNDDTQGTMSRRDDCRAFADRWGLKMISIAQLVEYRQATETNGTGRHVNGKTEAKVNGVNGINGHH